LYYNYSKEKYYQNSEYEVHLAQNTPGAEISAF
jgi:hypothetical protein